MRYWSYWDNGVASKTWPHIRTCLGSMRRVLGDDLTVVTADNVRELIPDGVLNPRLWDIPQLGPRVCGIRAALLFLYGGCWVDADTVMLRKPEIDHDIDIAYSEWQPTEKCPFRRVLSGYIAARAGSPVIASWLANINRAVCEPRDEWWLVLGEQALTPAVEQWEDVRGIRWMRWPVSTWIPLCMDTEPGMYCEPIDFRRYVRPHTVAFALNHSWLTYHHKWGLLLSDEAMAQSPLLIHQLLTYARAGR